MDPVRISRALARAAGELEFGPPVTHVYDPLRYARAPHEEYLRRYARPGIEALLIGMNPGPFGMAQTGVPFGDARVVREWLGVVGPVGKPEREHTRRAVQGFACARREVSGTRLWGWARERFGTPERFFRRFFVWNYCPLAFLEASGKNRTPDKLPAAEQRRLFAPCDRALVQLADELGPALVIGIGRFAAERAVQALPPERFATGSIPHPSPASPLANRGWARAADRALEKLGIRLG
jgi:single-strand selective monofunctional uracil DNA glycosylase